MTTSNYFDEARKAFYAFLTACLILLISYGIRYFTENPIFDVHFKKEIAIAIVGSGEITGALIIALLIYFLIFNRTVLTAGNKKIIAEMAIIVYCLAFSLTLICYDASTLSGSSIPSNLIKKVSDFFGSLCIFVILMLTLFIIARDYLAKWAVKFYHWIFSDHKRIMFAGIFLIVLFMIIGLCNHTSNQPISKNETPADKVQIPASSHGDDQKQAPDPPKYDQPKQTLDPNSPRPDPPKDASEDEFATSPEEAGH